ncbi:PrsW family glutamic-type intramembrane protease [Leucobacter ruminantium]|uniref:PrsW family intramembrane metalloprotease n=1 Tax=Leucobacter ruminantium TaxID=1289170 RepID=A0A939M410_9MICO|nr:PrsW family glutamic-type intramembrane protease [Leucobacter ruminantium]MBO1806565.1 PrsW family intramembrane metalloprotease [Leucobacter ruminantium]
MLLLIVLGAIYIIPQMITGIIGSSDPAVIVIGGIVQSALMAGFALLALPRRRVSGWMRFFAVLGGVFFATTVGMIFNNGSAAIAPFTEEIAKLGFAACVLWIVRNDIKGPLDGFVVGFCVGAGFEVLEDVFYAINTEDGAQVLETVISRTLSGFGLHSVFTALTCAGLAWMFIQGNKWWVALIALALGIAMHWIWDNSCLMPLVLYPILLSIFIAARVVLGRRERRNVSLVNEPV